MTKPQVMLFASIFTAFVILLSSCVQPKLPEPTNELATQSILSTDPASNATNVLPNAVVKIQFNGTMNKLFTERALTIFQGKYNPASNPATFTKLQLTAMCDGRWRTRNPNNFPLSFSWDVYQSAEKGVGVVLANSDALFYSSKASRTVRLFVGSQQQQVKASNTTTCTNEPYTFTWSNNDTTLIAKPSVTFDKGKEYTVVLSTSAKNLSGLGLTQPYSFTFTVKDNGLNQQQQLFIDSLSSLSFEQIVEVANILNQIKSNVSQAELDARAYQEITNRANLSSQIFAQQQLPNPDQYIDDNLKELNEVEREYIERLAKINKYATVALLWESREFALGMSAADVNKFDLVFPAWAALPNPPYTLKDYHFRDAFRHFSWSAWLGNLNSPEDARFWTNAHESVREDGSVDEASREKVTQKFAPNPSDPDYARKYQAYKNWIEMNSKMDLNNNAKGIEFGQTLGLAFPNPALNQRFVDYMFSRDSDVMVILTNQNPNNLPQSSDSRSYCKEVYFKGKHPDTDVDGEHLETWCLIPLEEHPDFPKQTASADGGAWSGFWGDPHISTPDQSRYSFQAIGDYVLTRSTTPGDTFQIQVRYKPFTTNGKQWSGENALAMSVNNDKVELYAKASGSVDVYVNNSLVTLNPDDVLRLPTGGVISRGGAGLKISWPDGTLLVASLNSPDPTKDLRGFTNVYFPAFRRNKVEGLLGNFDGSPANDFKIRNGQTLTNPSESDLYVGGYRDSWNVYRGASASLFSQVADPYNASYPNEQISLATLPSAEVETASQQCRNVGITNAFFLKTCIIDVVVTGNTNWITNTAAAAQALDPSQLSIAVNPPATALEAGKSQEFTAIVRGTNSDVTWTASGGTITGSGGIIVYHAPTTAGTYTLTARLNSNSSVVDVARILVTPEPTMIRLTDVRDQVSQIEGRSFAISGDGQTVAYGTKQYNVQPPKWNMKLINLQTGSEDYWGYSVGTGHFVPDYFRYLVAELSGNGRYFVAIDCDSSCYSSNGTSGRSDIIHKDLLGSERQVNTRDDGNSNGLESTEPSLSSDGQYVAFTSGSRSSNQTISTNLVSQDTDSRADVYLKDVASGAISLVSTNTQGVKGNGASYRPSVSINGRYVAFVSEATNLSPQDTNADADIYLKDTQTGLLTYIGKGNYPNMSANGRYIVFFNSQLSIYDTQTQTVQTMTNSNGSGEPSADGRFVTYQGTDFNVYVRDMVTGVVAQINRTPEGTPANSGGGSIVISGDGKYILFSSSASNLVPNDTNARTDVFRAVNPLFQ
jgi:von Willebrand factor type D domain/WD40-like Beta Propeller Repeat